MSKKDIEFMVESQIKARGIENEKILLAFAEVDRKCFVPEEYISESYEDHPISIGFGQTISQPAMVAEMLSEANIDEGNRVLEVGAGSGYVLALLHKLGAIPFGVERIKDHAQRIPKNFRKAGVPEIPVKIGDGTKGWKEKSPFDRIIVSAASSDIPEELIKQLTVGGILVAPIGSSYVQRLTVATKTEKGLKIEQKTPCVFVPLIPDEKI
ncbi:MAG: protein-L-isoaspartate(D-aspartate) O-methyltransferase [Acidobacteria bacterium]|nr:protein-L-isoaspartate(D-aspartate) O-methyltransferase [Acidobacteriota bacterium]